MSAVAQSALPRERKNWHEIAPALLVVLSPLIVIASLVYVPAFRFDFENHWFHFQIVSFVSLVALILGVTTIVLLQSEQDARALFIPVGLGAIAAIFLIHGLATPGVLEIPSAHPDHAATELLFSRPDLAVTWSGPFSLAVGGIFFALASLNWSVATRAWLVKNRRRILLACGIAYGVYVLIAVFLPQPFDALTNLAPTTRYLLAGLAALFYFGAAWRFWQDYRVSHRGFDAALAVAAVLLGEAPIPLAVLPVWSGGWWVYHVMMLLAFCIALGAVVSEYERARHFQLTTYFTAVSVGVAALLALVSGSLVTQLVSPLIPPTEVTLVQWGATGIFLGMAALMFCALWFVVQRGDALLQEHGGQLQQQHLALERGRIAEALMPVGLTIGTTLDLDHVLNLICRESHQLFQADTALIWYKEGEELIGRGAFGRHGADFLGMRQPLGNNSLLGARVVREERPIYVNHAQRSSGVSAALVKRFGIESIMGVPLLGEQEVFGALVLIDCTLAERFGEPDLNIARLLGQQAAQAITHARLYEKIQSQAHQLSSTLDDLRTNYNQTLAALSAALDARDHETEGHARRVTAYTLVLADALKIHDPATREAIEWGALLHDVGKIGVPDAILHKPGELTEEEWRVMRRHPDIGYEILQSIPFLKPAVPVVRHHHERWDGMGYPLRLRDCEIPLPARIFAIADTLDAITTNRPYRSARPFRAAFGEIHRMRGTQFDPEIVDVFTTIPQETWHSISVQITAQPIIVGSLLQGAE